MSARRSSEIVQELDRLFAEEVEAALRYLHLQSAVRGLDRLLVVPVLQKAFEETVEHAQVIARKILSLGGVPSMNVTLQLEPLSVGGKQALELALTFEEAALEAYQDCLRRVDGDVAIEEFIRQQIVLESEHVAELKQLLVE